MSQYLIHFTDSAALDALDGECLPKWKERIAAYIAALDKPRKMQTIARALGHACDSYWLRLFRDLRAEGRVVKYPEHRYGPPGL